MPSPGLLAGDKVVNLAQLVRSTALLAGAAASGASLWTLKHSALWTFAALVPGAVAGFALGSYMGRASLLAHAGQMVVVKLGPGATPLALKAGLLAGVCSGTVLSAISAFCFSPVWPGSQIVATGAVTGAAVGSLVAYFATRP